MVASRLYFPGDKNMSQVKYQRPGCFWRGEGPVGQWKTPQISDAIIFRYVFFRPQFEPNHDFMFALLRFSHFVDLRPWEMPSFRRHRNPLPPFFGAKSGQPCSPLPLGARGWAWPRAVRWSVEGAAMHSGESSSTIRVVVVVSNWGYLWFVPITGVSNYVIYIWENLVLTIDITIYLF